MLMKELKDKRVGVWGLGTEGAGILEYINKHNLTDKLVLLSDTAMDKPIGFEGYPIFVGEEILSQFDKVDIIVKSPGISIYRDEVIKAKQMGVEITSISDLFLNEMRTNKPNCKVIGISGSKGKSISVSALAHILSGLGYKTGLGGNIGRALTELLDDDYDFVVAELSSYQAADLTASPQIAMFTNLFFVHTEWHHGHDNYCKDKIHLIANQKEGDVFFVNERNEQSISYTNRYSDFRMFYNNTNGFHAEIKYLYYKNEKLLGIDDLKINGYHNLDNFAGVFSILKFLGVDIKKAVDVLKTFEPLSHRLQKIAVKDGVVFINDSISTAPEAAISGANSFEGNIAIISGGVNNDQDYTPYADNIENNQNIKMLATVFQNGQHITDVVGKRIRREGLVMIEAKTLEEAVSKSYDYLKEIGGGVVIFSPTSPSFDAYKNFMERGNHFIKIVENL